METDHRLKQSARRARDFARNERDVTRSTNIGTIWLPGQCLGFCHCERSETIRRRRFARELDRFASLAMTGESDANPFNQNPY